MRKLFTFLLALAASVGMLNAKVTWDSSNISDFYVMGIYGSYSKDDVTLSTNAEYVNAQWQSSTDDISFTTNEPGGFTFSNTLDKNFTKIEMTLSDLGAWSYANLGSGWSSSWGDYWMNEPSTVTWTGNASTVDLLKYEDDFDGKHVKSIVFYFEGDSDEPGPAKYTLRLLADPEKGSVALQNPSSDIVDIFGNYNVPENAEITILATPLEGYEFTGWRVGTIEEMCYESYCGGDVLSTNDNPLTVTMTADVAYVADFAAAAPQPVVLADCGLGWLNVPEGGVVGTIGHEDEIVLPQVNASSDFILAFQAHTATLRLGSTDESVLAVYGFNNFAVNGVGECDVYVVHDEDAVFAYDSAAFHVTVNPEPQPANPIAVENGTKGGFSYTLYDNGLLEISGSGAMPDMAFVEEDFSADVKNIRFAKDCEVYSLGTMWFRCYDNKNSQLETVEINSVVPISFLGKGIFYAQESAVTITITATGIVNVESAIDPKL